MSSLAITEGNPGSYLQFAEVNNLDPSSPDTVQRHSDALAGWREGLAATRGVTSEDLHFLGFQAIEHTEL